MDEDGIAGRARLLGERSSGRGRTTEPRASGGQFAPPGDVVTKSVETLDVDGEVMGDANVMEAMAATATSRSARRGGFATPRRTARRAPRRAAGRCRRVGTPCCGRIAE